MTDEIFNLLQDTKIYMSCSRGNNRKHNKTSKQFKIGRGRSQTLGIVCPLSLKLKGKRGLDCFALSKFSEKNPILYEKVKAYGDLHGKYTTIQINKNFKCNKHKDGINTGVSMIVGLGDYTGGEICIEYEDGIKKIDIKNKPYSFDGSKYYHWVEDFKGTRYTMVYFNQKRYEKLLNNI